MQLSVIVLTFKEIFGRQRVSWTEVKAAGRNTDQWEEFQWTTCTGITDMHQISDSQTLGCRPNLAYKGILVGPQDPFLKKFLTNASAENVIKCNDLNVI